MRFLVVKNWEKYQHQSERKLPWIKLFTTLLEPTRDPDYALLSDTAKILLHHIWLMARVFKNRIPEDWLTRERLNLQSRVSLEPLLEGGWIWYEDDSTSLTHAHRASRVLALYASSIKTNTTGECEGGCTEIDSGEAFEAVWHSYPRKRGRDKAAASFRSQIKSQSDLDAIRGAITNYRSEVAALALEERFILHGSTFFAGRWKDFVDGSWTPPTRVQPSLLVGLEAEIVHTFPHVNCPVCIEEPPMLNGAVEGGFH